MYLKRSYRTTIEIMEDANKTLSKLGFMPANNVIRHGEDVDYVGDNSLDTIQSQLRELKAKPA